MSKIKYERTVEAALTETGSKFKLAEALAMEIPPAKRGPGNEIKISDQLDEARQAIIDAGGEPKSVSTLANYRRTAIWVLTVNSQNFRWVKGASFTAHYEAFAAGMTYDEFARIDKPTVDLIRKRTGRAGTDGPPEKIVDEWTPEERVAAARKLMQDGNAKAAAREELDREYANAERQGATRSSSASSALDEALDLVYELRQLHKGIDRIVGLVNSGRAKVTGRDNVLREIDWLRTALGYIEDGVRGDNLEQEIAEFLEAQS